MNSFSKCALIFWLIFFLNTGIQTNSGRNPSGKMTINQMSRYSVVELESQKTRFNENESINIQFRIKNTGYQIIRFYPKLENPGSYKFLVVDRAGREIKPREVAMDHFNTKTIMNLQGDRVKEIILHPNESFEKTIDLGKLYNLTSGKQYRVSGYFWPNVKDKEYFIRSKNVLRIQIDKQKSRRTFQSASLQLNKNTPLVTPEETIFLFLAAEMRQNWHNHLKYLDIKRYITSYDRYASAFVQASPSEKPRVVAGFKKYLMSNPADKLINFKVIQSDPERISDGNVKQRGRYFVIVTALRADRGYSARYEYKYTLEQFLDHGVWHWKIINVEATLKNTGDNE